MGVDISLHIEIRRREKWQLLVIESPLLEKLLISGISHVGIYSIKEQLDRIEKKLDGEELEKEVDEDRLNRYEETTSIEQMYKDFMWDYGCLFWFRDRVRALTSMGGSNIPDSDIRIFYLVC